MSYLGMHTGLIALENVTVSVSMTAMSKYAVIPLYWECLDMTWISRINKLESSLSETWFLSPIRTFHWLKIINSCSEWTKNMFCQVAVYNHKMHLLLSSSYFLKAMQHSLKYNYIVFISKFIKLCYNELLKFILAVAFEGQLEVELAFQNLTYPNLT